MQTIKNQAAKNLILLVAAGTLVTACGPPGPQAVIEGKRLLERGEYGRAIEELRTATQLLPTNALAFNYLGLACQEAGQSAEAERAYLRALALDHDLTEVHYDLGCLWLSQSNKVDQAKAELTAFTMRRANSAEGWLKLGEAQFRSRELSAAEKSFGEALRLNPQNPAALTAMGLARYQRKRANEAAQFFVKALKEQPNYGPALLNLAVVAQQDLNDPRLALQKYREYLALKPAPENLQAVSVVARQLEQELNPVAHAPTTNAAVQAATNTNGLKATVAESARPAGQPKPPATNASRASVPARPELTTNIAKTSIMTNAQRPAPVTNSVPAENVETVKLGAEPVFKPAEDVTAAPPPRPPAKSEAPIETPLSTSAQTDANSQRRGFFQRINPINLFTRDGKTSTRPGPLVASAGNPSAEQTSAPTASNESVSNGEARRFPRYTYRSPEKPGAGDRSAAERAFARGVQEQRARRLPEAIQAYRQAAQMDPGFFDAHYNLGLAASENGNLGLALAAYETALAIQPESLDARYNFGLVLKQAGYVPDAIAEFERILANYPNDSRTHLALGNLYAQQLQQPAKARPHYMAVLATAPQSPQAGAIRYWLSDHPK